MTSEMNKSDLQDVWQSEQKEIDMDMIIYARDQLERGRMIGRRYYNLMLAAIAIITVLLIWAEWSGILSTYWIAPVLYALITVYSTVKVFAGRRKMPEILSLGPVDLLKNAIDRAKNNLKVARTLYAVYPCGLLCGVLFERLGLSDVILGESDITGVPTVLKVILIACGILSMIASMVYGVRLAREKQIELKELRTRLEDLEGNL